MGLQGREGKRGRAGRDGERGLTGAIGVKGDTGRFDDQMNIYIYIWIHILCFFSLKSWNDGIAWR